MEIRPNTLHNPNDHLVTREESTILLDECSGIAIIDGDSDAVPAGGGREMAGSKSFIIGGSEVPEMADFRFRDFLSHSGRVFSEEAVVDTAVSQRRTHEEENKKG